MNFNEFKEIKINNLTVIQLQLGDNIIWKKEQPQPTTSYDYQVATTLSELTTDDKIQYSYSYDNKTWYSLNNLNQYEKYGVIENVDDLSNATSYPNKLVNLNNVEYEFKNGQWVNLGEITGGFGLVGQISMELRDTTFPTDFYLKKDDIESMGMFYLQMGLMNGSLRINDWEQIINDYGQGGSYQGTKEEVEIDGVTYIHFYFPDYPNDTVDVMDCMWWNEPIDYYGSSIVYPKQYDKTIFDNYSLYQGYPYNSFDEIEYKGKGIIYNIDGYLYKDYERTNINPYNLNYGSISGTPITEIKLLDENITSIGGMAFQYCSSLTSVTMGDSVTEIGGMAFYGCSGLTSVVVGDSVTSIGGSAFNGCSNLTDIEIPNSVTSIGNYAFNGCSGLTSVVVGDSVTSIGYYAFYGCINVENIIFKGSTPPKYSGTTTNYYHPFGFARTSSYSGRTDYCGANVASPKIYYPYDGVNYDTNSNDYSWLYVASISRTSTAKYYVTGSTTSVNVKGYGFTKVKEYGSITLTLEDGTKQTDHLTTFAWTYSGRTDIVGVEIDDKITTIGQNAFNGCSGLTSVTIPNSVTSIGDMAFNGCSGLTSVTIGSGVTSIGNYAFSGCTSLTSVTIPNSVETIGSSAFTSCYSLTSVTIGSGVTTINQNAFGGCSGLTSIDIPNSVTSIQSDAFQGCSSLTSVTIGSGVTTIYDSVFVSCSSLTNVTIPNSVTKIRYWAFRRCTSLKDIYYNDTKAQWDAIEKESAWLMDVTGLVNVHCTDGDIAI